MNKLAIQLSFLTITFSPLWAFSQGMQPYFRTSGQAGVSSATSMNSIAATPAPVGQANAVTVIGQDESNHIITTTLPFLSITPDSRAAALGDAGAALSPDANSAYWNAGKLAFIDKSYGGSASYTPWLGKIVNDMWLFQLAGFYKLNHNQTIGGGLKYFNYGTVVLKDQFNQPLGTYSPHDVALEFTYSQLLTEHLSLGGTLRYLYSNLTGSASATGADAHSSNTVAADIGVFYTKPMVSSNSSISLAASISNIGPKVTYTGSDQANFIPTNLRLGAAYKTEVSPQNSFTFLLDFNKLMVPSHTTTSSTDPLLSGMFGSFSDSPQGFKGEIKEIMTSAGIEYWYDNIFAARLGYFYEAKDYGNRKYLTSGVGLRYNQFGLDVAYLVPTNQRESPLAETIRFTLLMHIDTKLKDQETLTD